MIQTVAVCLVWEEAKLCCHLLDMLMRFISFDFLFSNAWTLHFAEVVLQNVINNKLKFSDCERDIFKKKLFVLEDKY
jgi:hypothetical protein